MTTTLIISRDPATFQYSSDPNRPLRYIEVQAEADGVFKVIGTPFNGCDKDLPSGDWYGYDYNHHGIRKDGGTEVHKYNFHPNGTLKPSA